MPRGRSALLADPDQELRLLTWCPASSIPPCSKRRPALNTAGAANAYYVLSDRGTWIHFKNKGDARYQRGPRHLAKL
jgi:hypothetical protein